jgi:GGDEF domain-containing protein
MVSPVLPVEAAASGAHPRSSSASYLAWALVLALATTAASILLRVATGSGPMLENLRAESGFYGREWLGVSVVFGVSAWIAGKRLDRARGRRDWYRGKAQHDDLTGFLSPSAFRQAIAASVASAGGRAPLAVLLATVEGLHGVERERGSGLTKAALLHVAAAVRYVAPPDTIISRWGGMEIAMLLPTPGLDLDGVPQRLAERIAERPVLDAGNRIFFRSVVGGYFGPGNLPPERILLKAEEALIEAHRTGKAFHIAAA